MYLFFLIPTLSSYRIKEIINGINDKLQKTLDEHTQNIEKIIEKVIEKCFEKQNKSIVDTIDNAIENCISKQNFCVSCLKRKEEEEEK